MTFSRASVGMSKLVDCDVCDREHVAPPKPPEGYCSFSVPLMCGQTYKKKVRQWIQNNTDWRRITRCRKQWWGASIEH